MVYASRVDFFNRENSSWSYVEHFVNSFSSILQFDNQERNFLYEQFVDFQTLSEVELPNGASADAIIKEFEDEDGKTQNEYRMDVLWYHLQSMKSPIRNNKRFNSDCNGTQTHNHLVHKRTLNHLAKLTK